MPDSDPRAGLLAEAEAKLAAAIVVLDDLGLNIAAAHATQAANLVAQERAERG